MFSLLLRFSCGLYTTTLNMILDQIAWVDIIVFLTFLVPQLLTDVAFTDLAICGIKALPFLGRYESNSKIVEHLG